MEWNSSISVVSRGLPVIPVNLIGGLLFLLLSAALWLHLRAPGGLQLLVRPEDCPLQVLQYPFRVGRPPGGGRWGGALISATEHPRSQSKAGEKRDALESGGCPSPESNPARPGVPTSCLAGESPPRGLGQGRAGPGWALAEFASGPAEDTGMFFRAVGNSVEGRAWGVRPRTIKNGRRGFTQPPPCCWDYTGSPRFTTVHPVSV